jgi:hypothetical protein
MILVSSEKPKAVARFLSELLKRGSGRERPGAERGLEAHGERSLSEPPGQATVRLLRPSAGPARPSRENQREASR